MQVTTYEEEDLVPFSVSKSLDPLEAQSPPKWMFVRDVPGDNPELLGEFDNKKLTDRLDEKGVFDRGGTPAPEDCILYVYFHSKAAGRHFINALNKWLLEKAKLVTEARSY